MMDKKHDIRNMSVIVHHRTVFSDGLHGWALPRSKYAAKFGVDELKNELKNTDSPTCKRSEERQLTGKAFTKRVMQAWLPASDALIEMISSTFLLLPRHKCIVRRTCTKVHSMMCIHMQSETVIRTALLCRMYRR
ncbi:unnamed protein product [Musa acuminata var. zebrina]